MPSGCVGHAARQRCLIDRGKLTLLGRMPDVVTVRIKQGSAAKEVAERICSVIKRGDTIQVENAGEICQKLVSVVEMAKRKLKAENVPIFQYNRLQIKGTERLAGDELLRGEGKIHHRIPQFTILLSQSKVANLEANWTVQ